MKLLEQNREGEWEYTDPAQLEMVFELELFTARDLTGWDVLLQDVSAWQGHENTRAYLQECRAELFDKFTRRYSDNESLEDALNLYWERFTRARMQITGKALEIDRNTKIKEKRNASAKGGQAGFGKPKSALAQMVDYALTHGVSRIPKQNDGSPLVPTLWPRVVKWLQDNRADGDPHITDWPDGADNVIKIELMRAQTITVVSGGKRQDKTLYALWRQVEERAKMKVSVPL